MQETNKFFRKRIDGSLPVKLFKDGITYRTV